MKSKRPETVLMSTMASPPSDGADSPTPRSEGSPRTRPPRESRPKRAVEREAGWRPRENVLEIAAASGHFGIFCRAIDTVGLTRRLSERGPFTLFMPTDKAFAKMDRAELDAVLADNVRLHELLGSHVVPAAVRAPRRATPTSVQALNGRDHQIRVVTEDGGYQIGDARIVKTNIRASNGIIHAIDTVLVPR